MKNILEWEELESTNTCESNFRAKVFGGWIVSMTGYIEDINGEETIVQSSVFVPDKNNEWEI